MRLHRGVPMLAAVLTLAGTSTPAADAFELVSNGTATGQPTPVSQHQSGASDQWVLDAGAAGGLVLIATGLAVSRSRARKRQQADAVRVP